MIRDPRQPDLLDGSPKRPEPIPFGTDPEKLVRRNDPSTSIDAACEVNSAKWEEKVLSAIKSFGHDGCISDEVRSFFPALPYSTITARYKALTDKKLIEDTGKRRPGLSGRNQRVLRAI